jgi:hypothetical protein
MPAAAMDQDGAIDVDDFAELLRPLFEAVGGKPVDTTLADALDSLFPADGEYFAAIELACQEAIAVGWMCQEGEGDRRFGRVFAPAESTFGMSVDVVDANDKVGPYHRHPKGEICMVVPVTPGTTFCDRPRGWCIFPPGSAHHPTVRGGEALVLYLLPQGEIEFLPDPPKGP